MDEIDVIDDPMFLYENPPYHWLVRSFIVRVLRKNAGQKMRYRDLCRACNASRHGRIWNQELLILEHDGRLTLDFKSRPRMVIIP